MRGRGNIKRLAGLRRVRLSDGPGGGGSFFVGWLTFYACLAARGIGTYIINIITKSPTWSVL
jgi:hypothetical protein